MIAEGNGKIGIAFSRREAVAQAGDEQIADLRVQHDRLLANGVDRDFGSIGVRQSDIRPADPLMTGSLGDKFARNPPFAPGILVEAGTGHTGQPQLDRM